MLLDKNFQMENETKNSRQITRLLHEWKRGKKEAFDKLFPFIYEELHRRASGYLKNERAGHTLQTTALVNEAYLKLVDKSEIDYEDRNHFFAIAANAMRRILVDYARTKKRDKRGGKEENLPLDEARFVASNEKPIDLVALDEALNELAEFDERQAKVVELKYFVGMTFDEAAEVLGVSNATVRRDWDMAKAWLFQKIKN
jgi:RNA polymerase sigma factor (TIGR02999 family)